MIMARAAVALAALAVCAEGFEHEQRVCPNDKPTNVSDTIFKERVVVFDEAMGARVVVAGDINKDGRNDLVVASSTDNAIRWFENIGDQGWSRPQKITYDAKGARVVALADIDGDGYLDVVYASYYDNTVGWFKNSLRTDMEDRRKLFVSMREFNSEEPRYISRTVDEGQGVVVCVEIKFTARSFAASTSTPSTRHLLDTLVDITQVVVADLDGDGDPDVATASSGDSSIAWFENIGGGRFCEIKRVVDDDAVGARSVVAADFDGDGLNDLASASKDDNTVALYLNREGFAKRVVSSERKGAYGLAAADVDMDGHVDLVVASNGDNTVSWYRNVGNGTRWEYREIYTDAIFVLSVTTGDFDRDGDLDVASASFHDGAVRWYENLGDARSWKAHDLRVVKGTQGHYVHAADLDGDGDDDLVAATHSENTVAVFYASTACDAGPSRECCRTGQRWSGSACVDCAEGTYGTEAGVCVDCPAGCAVPGLPVTPITCFTSATCDDLRTEARFEEGLADCACDENEFLSDTSDTCAACPDGQAKTASKPRGPDTYEEWIGDCPSGVRCTVNGDCGVDELCVVESKSTRGCCRAPKGRDWEGFQEENCVVVPQSGHSSNSKKGLSRSEKSGLIALAVIVGCICALFLLWLALRLRQKYVMLRESARMHETTTQLRLAKAIASPAECRYTVCFLSYRDFREAGALRSHEWERRRLVMLDSYDDVVSFCTKVPTVFVSHQWLGRKHPDPRGVHYQAIISACDEMCRQKDVDPSKLYLWVDYVSVPQKNKILQELSIGSITVYAAACRYFLAVAPRTVHQSTGMVCDSASYQRRGWCRLEQFARMAVGDLRDMVLWEDGRLLEIGKDADRYRDSCEVFQGEFMDEQDKNKIVETFLGLYAILLANRDEGDNHVVIETIEARRDAVFPESYFHDLPARLEREIEEQREAAQRSLEESTTGATKRSWGSSSSRSGSMDSGGVTSQTTDSKASRFAFLRSFSTKGSQALLDQQNSLVSLDSYAFPTHEKSVTLSAATTRTKVAGMKLTASDGDGDEDALSPV